MARTDNDTWDLASSVGTTATAVAASRAMASQGPEPLLDDPWADPLVRAVGIERFIKLVDGEIGPADDSPLNRRTMREQSRCAPASSTTSSCRRQAPASGRP